MIQWNRILALLGVAVLVAACGATPAITLANADLMPELVLIQDVRVQEAYRFAVAHPEDLETIPCYCGCVGLDHRNNLECYLTAESKPEALVFDNHALGCNICVEITQMTMDLLSAGLSPTDIRNTIDTQFSERGPGTDTAYPSQSS